MSSKKYEDREHKKCVLKNKLRN